MSFSPVLLGLAGVLSLLAFLNEFGDKLAGHNPDADGGTNASCNDGTCKRPAGPVTRMYNRAMRYIFKTSNPLLQCLFSLIVHGGFGIFFVQGYHWLPTGSFHRYSSPVVFGVCLYTFITASFSSPGRVTRAALAANYFPTSPAPAPAPAVAATAATGTAPPAVAPISTPAYDGALSFPGLLCAPCGGVPRAPGTKHCHLCGHCVPGFDHHCVWINTCVGARNRPAFLTFLGVHALLTTYGSYVLEVVFSEIYVHHGLATATYKHPVTGEPTALTIWTVSRFFGRYYPWMWALCILIHIMGLVVFLFACFHFYLLLCGRTTNGDVLLGRLGRWVASEERAREDAAAAIAACADAAAAAAVTTASTTGAANGASANGVATTVVRAEATAARAAREKEVQWAGSLVQALLLRLAAAAAAAAETATQAALDPDAAGVKVEAESRGQGRGETEGSQVRDRKPAPHSGHTSASASAAATPTGASGPTVVACPWPAPAAALPPAGCTPAAAALIELLARPPWELAAAEKRRSRGASKGASRGPAEGATTGHACGDTAATRAPVVAAVNTASAGCVPTSTSTSTSAASAPAVVAVDAAPAMFTAAAAPSTAARAAAAAAARTADWPALLQQPSSAFLSLLLPTVAAHPPPRHTTSVGTGSVAQKGGTDACANTDGDGGAMPQCLYARLLLASSAAAVSALTNAPLAPALLPLLPAATAAAATAGADVGASLTACVCRRCPLLACAPGAALGPRAAAVALALANCDWSRLYATNSGSGSGVSLDTAEAASERVSSVAADAVAAVLCLLWGDAQWDAYCTADAATDVTTGAATANAPTAAAAATALVSSGEAGQAAATEARLPLSFPFPTVPLRLPFVMAAAVGAGVGGGGGGARQWPVSVLPVCLWPWSYWRRAEIVEGGLSGHGGDCGGVVANVRAVFGAAAGVWPE
jgi:palmitoyltransferase